VGAGRCGIAIKTDTWTASIVDLSYPLALSCFRRVDILEASSVARFSTDGGPGVKRGGISREGGCESEVCDGFDRSLMRFPSIVIVVGSGIGPIDGCVGDVGIGATWVLFGFLTYVTDMGLSPAQFPTSSFNEKSLSELPELSFLSCAGLPPKLEIQTSHSLGFLTFLFLSPFLPTITKSVVPGISSTSYSGFPCPAMTRCGRPRFQQWYTSKPRKKRQKQPRKVRGKIFARASMVPDGAFDLRFRD